METEKIVMVATKIFKVAERENIWETESGQYLFLDDNGQPVEWVIKSGEKFSLFDNHFEKPLIVQLRYNYQWRIFDKETHKEVMG
ncbi:MAG: hypothetical protein KAJ58_02185 [Candidatus Pacebacteria bacterium]|nr:hypothetical protein [Candidatus Paceibacterota bacterium]